MTVPLSQRLFAEIARRGSHVTEEGIGGAVERVRVDDISPRTFAGYADAEQAAARCCRGVDELVIEDSARLFPECRWDGADRQEEQQPESTSHRTKSTVTASVRREGRLSSGEGDSAAVEKAVGPRHCCLALLRTGLGARGQQCECSW